MPSPVELNELRNMSGGVRKRILELLHGLHVPKTLTAAQAGTIQSVVADDVGQLIRVGPYVPGGLRTEVYDWWVAQTVEPTTWRQLDSLSIPYFASIYATIASVALKAPILSPFFTGTPRAPTAAVGTSTTQIATTEMVTNSVAPALAGLALKANITSPNCLGAPTAITPAVDDNTQRLATTAFVKRAITNAIPSVAAGTNIISSETPLTDRAALWHDTIDNTINYWDGTWWVTDSTIPVLSSGEEVTNPEEDTLPDGSYFFLADGTTGLWDAQVYLADTDGAVAKEAP